jgi:DNA-directed RNA polymerase sigma subunit (sigma70/sigma32)
VNDSKTPFPVRPIRTQREVAEKLNISRNRVSQIEQEALKKLAKCEILRKYK